MAKTLLQYNYCYDSRENKKQKCVLTLTNGEKVQLAEKCNKYTTTNGCHDSSKLNLTIQDYNLMMGLTANFLGFMMVFLVGFLFVLQGRR